MSHYKELMEWNLSWGIKDTSIYISFELIPFGNKLHQSWSTRYIPVSMWVEGALICLESRLYLREYRVLQGRVYKENALHESSLSWTGRGTELLRERVEMSLAIWSVPQPGKPVRVGAQAKGNCPERIVYIPPRGSEARGLWARNRSVTDTCADRSQHRMLNHVHTKLIRMDGSLLMP